MFPKRPGVYCLKNTVNNKVYIGSAQCLYTRINKHLKNVGSNQYLQNAIKHYGIDSFCITYQVLETKEKALCLEQMLLDYIFKLDLPKYNLSHCAAGGKTLSDYSNHANISEKGGGCEAKVRFTLEVSNPNKTYDFKSSVEAAKFTGVSPGNVFASCKTAKPENSGSKRWLFSDVSVDDLKSKFNNLTQKEIKGLMNRPFILIDKITEEQSLVFYGVYEPQKQGYKINHSHLSQCLLGRLKTVNGYRVALCI